MGVDVYEAEYCAYAVLNRQILPVSGEFQVDQSPRGRYGLRFLSRGKDEL